jgi:hypothetical protein
VDEVVATIDQELCTGLPLPRERRRRMDRYALSHDERRLDHHWHSYADPER